MSERPIIFTGPSIAAILSGEKSQSRRVMRHQPPKMADDLWPNAKSHVTWYDFLNDVDYYIDCGYCPYGKPGDILYVRERWRTLEEFDTLSPSAISRALAREGYCPEWFPVQYGDEQIIEWNVRKGGFGRWRSPLHLPRWASRITLEITDVRVQRLFDISQADAKAEGVSIEATRTLTHVGAFAITWDTINKKRGFGWEGGSNPWVWALTFRRVQP